MASTPLVLHPFVTSSRDQQTPDPLADVVCKVADSREERESAFRLVYNSYLRSGLVDANPHRMRVTPHHLEPTTEVFVATLHGTVIATTTLVIDGALGLPMESVYANEVEQRREEGLLLGEVTCLADRRRDIRRFFPLFCKLNHLMVQYARRRGLDQLVVAVHPKHARFYIRYLCFEPLGDVTAYPSVKNHPAVALCMDFEHIDRKALEYPQRYARFFGEAIPPDQLEPRPMSSPEREYFRLKLEQRTQYALLSQPFIETPPGGRCAAV